MMSTLLLYSSRKEPTARRKRLSWRSYKHRRALRQHMLVHTAAHSTETVCACAGSAVARRVAQVAPAAAECGASQAKSRRASPKD